VSSELSFEAAGNSVPLTLRVSATARVLRLRVDRRTGAVVLTVPRRTSRRSALAWASGHRAWVEAQLKRIEPPLRLRPGSAIPLFDRPHIVDWDPARPRQPRLDGDRILVGGPPENVEARLVRWLRAEALLLLAAETAEFAAKAGVTVGRVSVGDPRSRWGSCSSSGAIRYSWRLILAPDFVRRATVAHEVAHRLHMDHSRAFHDCVERLLGEDPKRSSLWLRARGASLHRIAA
jgi:hypothetical protein